MSSSSHDHPLPPPRVEEVSDGVYAYVQPDGSWWINNTGFLAGRRGVVVIDACSTERRTRAFREAIGKVSGRPITTLVNTHHHGDHTFGNWLFPEATIVGHEGVREQIIADGVPAYRSAWSAGVEWGKMEPTPPFLTFTDRITLHSDELRCEVRHVGHAAHTTNDSYVWIPERRLLFTGDLVFNGGTPFVLMGSVAGALRALEQLRELGAQTLVPGHGEVCGPEAYEPVEGYLRFVRETARRGKQAGLTPLETALETDLGEWAGLLDPERVVGNLHRAYSELDGQPLGAPIDLVTAITDMITYNGGRPLSCLA
ncbi:MBL fold metallo-hydrolase [Nonomuraea gerenzanensis]|uniref:Putative polyketide cyclase n=1 Tax=Nonomuraea gerenzanensis TaxID=93944 RepID=A0A1M4DVA7_9ACTN|nr:MBL fold metallo-hydrolase [Nonomuraea gerenzanensis]UBU12848.1 MBL fold metallo-hydrolase [Nonomuraea gerenzanensis]SBO90498.1 putative polyketide cyclase [Nonomuraea gerenzanensis]